MPSLPQIDPTLQSFKQLLVDKFLTNPQETGAPSLVTSIGFGALPAPPGGVAPPPKIVVFIEPVADCQIDTLWQAAHKLAGDRFIFLPSGRFLGQAGPLAPGDSTSPDVPLEYNVPPVSAGSLGAVVETGGKSYVLSCNHVMAYNSRVPQDAPIIDPGTLDDLTGFSVIGSRAQFVELKPAAWPVNRSQTPANWNFADSALAELTAAGLGNLAPLAPAVPAADPLNTDVHKTGRTTGLTKGTIVLLDWEGFIDLSFGTFYFKELVGVLGKGPGPFAAPGDSGAVVIDDGTGAPVGMVMARVYSSGEFTPPAPAVLLFPADALVGYIVLMCPMTAVAKGLAPDKKIAFSVS